MSTVFLGLGSNLDEPIAQLRQAIVALQQMPHSRVIAVSPLYRSPPLDGSAQPDYVNAVAQIDTQLLPDDLLQHVQQIEQQQGRQRTQRWGARTLDIDLLLYDNHQQQQAHLTLPHPGIAEREFVVFPLMDLMPDLILPDGRALNTLAQALAHKPLQRITDD